MAAALAEIERALKALPVEQLKLLLHDEAEFDRCITFLLTLALKARCGEHDASVPVARCSHDGALRSYFEKHTPMLSEKQQLVAQIKQANIDLAHHNIRDEIAVTSTQTQAGSTGSDLVGEVSIRQVCRQADQQQSTGTGRRRRSHQEGA